MNLLDIENMTADELKGVHSDVVIAMVDDDKVTIPELAERYLQARQDAKIRDEKLAEQGGIIMSLQKGLNAAEEVLKAEVERMRKELSDAAEKYAVEYELVEKKVAAAMGENSRVMAEITERDVRITEGVELLKQGALLLTDERARANRMTIVATRNELAINASAKLLNDAIAQRLVDAADSGE